MNIFKQYLKRRRLRKLTSKKFIAFMQDLNPTHQKYYQVKELYRQFKRKGGEGNQREFETALGLYASLEPTISGYKPQLIGGNLNLMFFRNQPIFTYNLHKATLFQEKCSKVTAVTPEKRSKLYKI